MSDTHPLPRDLQRRLGQAWEDSLSTQSLFWNTYGVSNPLGRRTERLFNHQYMVPYIAGAGGEGRIAHRLTLHGRGSESRLPQKLPLEGHVLLASILRRCVVTIRECEKLFSKSSEETGHLRKYRKLLDGLRADLNKLEVTEHGSSRCYYGEVDYTDLLYVALEKLRKEPRTSEQESKESRLLRWIARHEQKVITAAEATALGWNRCSLDEKALFIDELSARGVARSNALHPDVDEPLERQTG